jgi:hypothetical protein
MALIRERVAKVNCMKMKQDESIKNKFPVICRQMQEN